MTVIMDLVVVLSAIHVHNHVLIVVPAHGLWLRNDERRHNVGAQR